MTDLDVEALRDLQLDRVRETVRRVTVGVTIEVDVVAPATLERSQGKAKRIDDRR